MNRYWNKKINQATPYVAGEQPKQGEKVIKLNTNENPYPPTPKIREVLDGFDISDLRLYPNTGSDIVRDAAAEVYGLKRENIFVGNTSARGAGLFGFTQAQYAGHDKIRGS